MRFKDKNVLITGAAQGIGREMARQFASEGARVAVHYYRSQEQAEKTLASLDGESHLHWQADIANADEARRLVDGVLDRMGRIDILVNNVAVFESHPIAKVSYEEWQTAWKLTLDSNLTAAANVTYCVAHAMIESGGGRIVNISSRGAFRGEPDAPAYGASKAGLNAMSQSLAQALAPHKIFVYVVAPGFV
ncbi:MAG: SDR family NAD(P)-dependent oxidoreductase, partial [Acidobacteriota bacterium]